MFVHNAETPVATALENVGYTSILEMLFMFSLPGGRHLGDLFCMKLQNICSHGAFGVQDFDVNLAYVDSHSGSTGQIFALTPQDNQPCRLGPLGIGAKDRGDLGVITLPLIRFLFREKLPKFADHGLDLSSAEQGL